MTAILLTGHGGPDVLCLTHDAPVPRPKKGEVLVRVAAAGVNNTDINTRLGWYAPEVTGQTAEGAIGESGGWAGGIGFPRIQGADLCGYVVALGEGVTHLKIGARVTAPTMQPEPTESAPTAFAAIGSEYDGAFAQYCVVPARHLFDVSASPLTDIEIAALPCAFSTAENMLERAGVRAGQRVLVTGASGGVGLAAVALAKIRGARVTAISGAQKAGAVRDAGAEEVLDRDAPLPERCFDAVIEVVGGAGFAERIASVKPGGAVSVSGAIAGPIVSVDLRRLYLDDITVRGCTYQAPEVFHRLVELINTGAIRPLISKTYPLSDIAVAQADFLTKRYAGKLVLIPPEPLS